MNPPTCLRNNDAVFVLPVRVYYEDTDAGGVVYYANYLKYMERARSDYLRKFGFDQGWLRDQLNCQFVVRSVAMDLHKPARLDDLLDVASEIEHYGRASLLFQQRVLRQTTDASPLLLCSASIKIACVDASTFRTAAIPAELVAAFKQT